MTTPIYTVRDPETDKVITGLSWTNASEQVRLYGKEWVHDFKEVLETAQTEAKNNSNTEGHTRKLTPAQEAQMQVPDLFAAAKSAVESVAEAGSSDLADMTREELFDIAAGMGLTFDKRTGHGKMVDLIEKKRFEAESEVKQATPTDEANDEE